MVRKKVYKKQHILVAAEDLLIEKGFSAITARSVAEYMGISTQPIYLEFKNMEELKLTLLKTVYEGLERDFFSTVRTSNTLANFGVNQIEFAKAKSKLYIALFVEQHSYGKELHQLSFNSFKKTIQSEVKYTNVSQEQLENIHLKLWIVASGMATLSISGILNKTEEQLIDVFTSIKLKSDATWI
ncbi:AcrR family transcriptional regulator [Enterococcus rotai]|uniref:HTH tetR-type domain-containing protein n=1 Tax=Enterococcus rotai TaxID=118060 RepID=A0A0U2X0W8_9ENTE|nr:TetR/AcrR family transcriptional regulator [Enterococcus rotai]ALS37994.1 hypothetical protein ATZ35_12825 [Enterococcus rotai]